MNGNCRGRSCGRCVWCFNINVPNVLVAKKDKMWLMAELAIQQKGWALLSHSLFFLITILVGFDNFLITHFVFPPNFLEHDSQFSSTKCSCLERRKFADKTTNFCMLRWACKYEFARLSNSIAIQSLMWIQIQQRSLTAKCFPPQLPSNSWTKLKLSYEIEFKLMKFRGNFLSFVLSFV